MSKWFILYISLVLSWKIYFKCIIILDTPTSLNHFFKIMGFRIVSIVQRHRTKVLIMDDTNRLYIIIYTLNINLCITRSLHTCIYYVYIHNKYR